MKTKDRNEEQSLKVKNIQSIIKLELSVHHGFELEPDNNAKYDVLLHYIMPLMS